MRHFSQIEINKMTNYIIAITPGYKHYKQYGLTKQDLLEAGTLGYIEAMSMHNHNKEDITSGYVFTYIKREISDLIKKMMRQSMISYIAEYKEDNITQFSISPELILEDIQTKEEMRKILNTLDVRTQRIIEDRYLTVPKKSVGYLAQELKISKQRIYQLEKKGIALLKELLYK